jgi:hypothetical protein
VTSDGGAAAADSSQGAGSMRRDLVIEILDNPDAGLYLLFIM